MAGAVVRELVAEPGSGARFGQAVFERGDRVLVAMWAQGRSAIARCDLAGRWETAGSRVSPRGGLAAGAVRGLVVTAYAFELRPDLGLTRRELEVLRLVARG